MGAALLAVVSLVAWRVAGSGGGEPARAAGTAADVIPAGPAGVVPPDLARFYGQPLTWGPCAGFAPPGEPRRLVDRAAFRCTRLEVPLDYAKPDGTVITIAVLRRPADEPDRRIGALVINPGGPGGSGVITAALLTGRIAGTVLGDRFDLVGFDPRGVGASEPAVRCRTDAEFDLDRADLDLDTSPDGVAQTRREDAEHAARCAQRVGPEFLAHVGTREVARDLDVLRSALGEPKLTYLGYSYGTLIGATYAGYFPANVRAMVLDGGYDPALDQTAGNVSQQAAFQAAFDAYATRCATRPTCPLGTDPAAATARVRALVAPLTAAPLPVGGRVLAYGDALLGIYAALYNDDSWSGLDVALADFVEGDGTKLLALADNFLGRVGDGYDNSLDAGIAVICVDHARLPDAAAGIEYDRRIRAAAPVFDDGRTAVDRLDMCGPWPAPPTRETLPASFPGLPTVLAIGTTGDPATPYHDGVTLAGILGARLLTYQGHQHTVFLDHNRCVDEAGTAYLVDDILPPEGTVCIGT